MLGHLFAHRAKEKSHWSGDGDVLRDRAAGPSGVISQLKTKVAPGGPDIVILKPRPWATLENVTSCVVSRLVVILPFVPFANGPSSCAALMPEFQQLQLFGSLHRLHTRSGEAVVDRETP